MYNKTVLDAAVRNELISRITTLSNGSVAGWGKMDVCQMIKHCILWDGMILENKKYPRVWIGRLIGRMILKDSLKDKPMPKNAPSIPPLIVRDSTGDLETLKKRWIALLEQYNTFLEPSPPFIHPFFGMMTKEQIGCHAYKHADHHLRQFNG